MKLVFKKASIADIELLTESRIEVVRSVYELDDSVNTSEIEKQSNDYYKEHLPNGEHIAYLIFDNDTFIGTGGVSFYKVMPTCDNPTGRKAFVMNMYIRPQYRRKGIASHILELLLEDVRKEGVTYIGLEASEMGKPLYIKHGFTEPKDELQLIFQTYE